MEDCKTMGKSVLVLTNNIGGLHSFRKEVISAIRETGWDVVISAPDKDDERTSYFEAIGCRIKCIYFNRRGKNPLTDIVLLVKYCRTIQRIKPTAVLTYTIKPNVYGGIACRVTKVPQIANITGLGDAVENGGWLHKLTMLLYKVGISRARQVFFQNTSNRDFCISNGIADSRSIVLPGSGVNLSHHTYQSYPADGPVKFLFISRLLRDKGVEEFFEMARTIKRKYPATEFQILGRMEGPYQNQLETLVSEGVIKYFGTTTDVRPYLAQVHCTILPSYHEGMSNVNLESSANGRPVITTGVPGCRETVEDSITGYIVKPHCAEGLIDAVERFIQLPYREKIKMGQAARKKVEREFDRGIVTEAYLRAIENLR